MSPPLRAGQNDHTVAWTTLTAEVEDLRQKWLPVHGDPIGFIAERSGLSKVDIAALEIFRLALWRNYATRDRFFKAVASAVRKEFEKE